MNQLRKVGEAMSIDEQSDTPRTDAAAQFVSHFGWQVHADFARTLERELATATRERDEWQQIAAANGLAGLETARELGKAREALHAIKLKAVSLADAQMTALEALVVMEEKP